MTNTTVSEPNNRTSTNLTYSVGPANGLNFPPGSTCVFQVCLLENIKEKKN